MLAVPIEPAAAKQELRTGVKRYLSAVLDEEWTRHNEVRTASAEAALGGLETGIMALDVQCRASAGCSNGPAIASFVKALDDLRLAREQRLALAIQSGVRLKWVLALSLALATS